MGTKLDQNPGMNPTQKPEPLVTSLPAEAEPASSDGVARIKLGSELAALGRLIGGVELDITRDPHPTEPISFD